MAQHARVRHLESPHDISDLIRKVPVVVALFGRRDCTECAYVYQRLERFVSRRSDYECIYVDLDQQPTLAGMHAVYEVPTTVVHVYATQISKQVGGIDLPKLRRDAEHVKEQVRNMQAEERGEASQES